jgi:hypothetical protein
MDMSPEVKSVFGAAVKHLREGNVQAADDLLSSTLQSAAPAVAAKPAAPRSPDVILVDIIRNMAGRMGNHPVLDSLIAEFETATKPTAHPAPKS